MIMGKRLILEQTASRHKAEGPLLKAEILGLRKSPVLAGAFSSFRMKKQNQEARGTSADNLPLPELSERPSPFLLSPEDEALFSDWGVAFSPLLACALLSDAPDKSFRLRRTWARMAGVSVMLCRLMRVFCTNSTTCGCPAGRL